MDVRLEAGNIKRIRQACANCRRKKTKCSGERPICFHCRRNNRACVYEPYSATVGGDNNPAAPSLASLETLTNNAELLQRICTIESRLAELSGQGLHQRRSVSSESASPENTVSSHSADNDAQQFSSQPNNLVSDPLSYHSFPPRPVLRSLVDTYFLHVHNQPYSYFQEASFRQKLESNLLPKCLVLAVLASAVRFSTHEYFAGRTREASDKYSRNSWLSVLSDHLTVEDNMSVHVVQTVNLLAIVDYTAGRVSSGWLKIGLAARISQDLHLMTEPDGWLSYAEQEERRRAFWSAYLVDKLISCGRSRPLAILDEDCNVQLPCDEQTFQNGEWKKTQTLGELLSWNTELSESPSPFALTILMASIFGRCTRYVHHKRITEEIPPWATKSEFSAINSSLLLLESYSKIGSRAISDIILENSRPDGTIDRAQVGHVIFAHTLFHLCHCLLNHPFLVRLRLKPFGSKTPGSFSSRALQSAGEHAKQLLDLLRDASGSGCLIESSFYAYCIAIAGGIHSLISHFELQSGGNRAPHLEHYFQQSLDDLDRLASMWTHASNMVIRLREFHAQSSKFASLLDPACLMEDLDPNSEEMLWSMIDYAILGSDPRKKPLSSGPTISNIPSPTSWGLGPEMLPAASPHFGAPTTDIFSGMTPSMRLNEVEYLLDCSPNPNALL